MRMHVIMTSQNIYTEDVGTFLVSMFRGDSKLNIIWEFVSKNQRECWEPPPCTFVSFVTKMVPIDEGYYMHKAQKLGIWQKWFSAINLLVHQRLLKSQPRAIESNNDSFHRVDMWYDKFCCKNEIKNPKTNYHNLWFIIACT